MLTGWGKQDEWAAKAGNELGDDASEHVGVGLYRCYRGNGIRRPSAKLECTRKPEAGGFRVAAEGFGLRL